MKLIIEVSENYIKERTNEEYFLQTMGGSGADAICALADMIAFKEILKEIDKEELIISPNLIELEENKRKMFDKTASMFAGTYLMLNKN